MSVAISSRKQDWNFLFWQALIWNKTKGNSNFSTYIFSYIWLSQFNTDSASQLKSPD